MMQDELGNLVQKAFVGPKGVTAQTSPRVASFRLNK